MFKSYTWTHLIFMTWVQKTTIHYGLIFLINDSNVLSNQTIIMLLSYIQTFRISLI